MIRPIAALGRPEASERASRFRTEAECARGRAGPCSAVAGATPYSPFSARDAVFRLTPARSATSASFGRLPLAHAGSSERAGPKLSRPAGDRRRRRADGRRTRCPWPRRRSSLRAASLRAPVRMARPATNESPAPTGLTPSDRSERRSRNSRGRSRPATPWRPAVTSAARAPSLRAARGPRRGPGRAVVPLGLDGFIRRAPSSAADASARLGVTTSGPTPRQPRKAARAASTDADGAGGRARSPRTARRRRPAPSAGGFRSPRRRAAGELLPRPAARRGEIGAKASGAGLVEDGDALVVFDDDDLRARLAGRHDPPDVVPFGIQHVADQLAHAPREVCDEARPDAVRAGGAADVDGLAAGRRPGPRAAAEHTRAAVVPGEASDRFPGSRLGRASFSPRSRDGFPHRIRARRAARPPPLPPQGACRRSRCAPASGGVPGSASRSHASGVRKLDPRRDPRSGPQGARANSPAGTRIHASTAWAPASAKRSHR